MTKLVLEIQNPADLQLLVPLLERLRIRYIRKEETKIVEENEIVEALRIIDEGCDMSNYGDALEYQKMVREDRELPHQD